MDNRKKIIFGLIAGIIFIIAFILNLLFPPKPFIKSAHAYESDAESLIDEYGYFIPGNQLVDSDNMVDHLPFLKGWLPDDYTYGDFLLDSATAFIGNFSASGSDVVDIGIQAIQNVIEAEGLWFDSTSGFIRYPNAAYFTLGEFHREYGYSSDEESIGYWVPLPVTVNYNSRTRLVRHSDTFTGQAYITTTGVYNGNYHYLVAYKGELISGYTYWVQYTGDFTCGSFYSGSFDSGYYNDIAGAQMTSSSFIGSYASPSEALADFFGNDIHGEPYENGSVYINEDAPPVNILSLPGNDGRSLSINRNNDINNDIDNPYGGFNNIVLSPKLEDVPNNYEYQLPIYPEVPHDLPEVAFEYPEIVANEEITEGLDSLSPLWVTLLTMGGSFIVLKVIL